MDEIEIPLSVLRTDIMKIPVLVVNILHTSSGLKGTFAKSELGDVSCRYTTRLVTEWGSQSTR